jgi:hypothetical protein
MEHLTGDGMTQNGKGSKKRPRFVSKDVEEANHTRIFGKRKYWWELRDLSNTPITLETPDDTPQRSNTDPTEPTPSSD